MKTNVKMRVTPEQLEKICNTISKEWLYFKSANYMYIFNDGSTEVSYSKENWNKYNLQEIDADLFIRTDGACEENTFNELFEKVSERVNDFQIGNMIKPLDKYRELEQKLQNKKIEQLKAENKSLKESSKISCNMLHSQKDKIDRLKLNYVAEQSNYKKEIEKLKAVIEYLESKVKWKS